MNAHQRRKSMTRRHRDWPRGTAVLVDARKLDAAIETGKFDPELVIADRQRMLLRGKVNGHIRGNDYACYVEFAIPIDIKGRGWLRYSHRIPLRLLRKVTP